MAEEKLLTVREVSAILGLSEKEVVDLAESGALEAYKVGGVYLRFKRDPVLAFQKKNKPQLPKPKNNGKYSAEERISDFFYFNDFYILAALIIAVLLFIILRGY